MIDKSRKTTAVLRIALLRSRANPIFTFDAILEVREYSSFIPAAIKGGAKRNAKPKKRSGPMTKYGTKRNIAQIDRNTIIYRKVTA